ncbi:hypothetical protein Hanom_Chr06g00517171 [Helianthus anomalus]
MMKTEKEVKLFRLTTSVKYKQLNALLINKTIHLHLVDGNLNFHLQARVAKNLHI